MYSKEPAAFRVMHKHKWTQQQHTHSFGVKKKEKPRGKDRKHISTRKGTSAQSRGDGEVRERERERDGEMKEGWRGLGRPVKLEEVLVRRPAGKWKKKGACRLPEASLGPSVLSFRRQVLH